MVLVERYEVADEQPLFGVRRRAVPGEEGEEVVAAGAREEQGPRQHAVGRSFAYARRDVALHGGELLDLLAQRDDESPLCEQSDRCALVNARAGNKIEYYWLWFRSQKRGLTVESRMPDPAEAKFTPRSPLWICLLVLFATARNGGGLRLNPMLRAG
jgi:hypothetical protein